MDKLSAFESYVSAVQSGSLSGAARLRGLSQPAISQQISALEADFGIRFLRRGRSGVQMTQAGELLYKHAQAILEQHSDLIAGLETLSERVAGRLVVTANPGFSQHVLGDVIVDLKRAHPDLDVILRADARILDIEAEGIDIALRSGTVGDGGGVVRKIATMSMLLVATPEYLDMAGRPETPDDLQRLDLVRFKASNDQIATTLRRGDEIIQAPIKIGFTAQYPDLVEKALIGGLGYAKTPEFLVAQNLRQGRLEVVLPDWAIPQIELFVVFPDREIRAPRFAAFLNVLLDHLARTAGIDVLPSTSRMRYQISDTG
jgi:DNA-binding transcriptional LysR family regulator